MSGSGCAVTPRNVNRLKLVGIGLLALLPVVGSYLLYWFWAPAEHTNYGTLLKPRPVTGVLNQVDGKPFDWQQLRGRWTLVTIDAGACAPSCERKLWLIRQVRQAQGEALRRVERVWLIDDAQVPPARLGEEYAGTWFVGAAASTHLEAFGDASHRREYIYLVDPLGNLMMRFPGEPDAKRLIRDLGRLLKYSRIG